VGAPKNFLSSRDCLNMVERRREKGKEEFTERTNSSTRSKKRGGRVGRKKRGVVGETLPAE